LGNGREVVHLPSVDIKSGWQGSKRQDNADDGCSDNKDARGEKETDDDLSAHWDLEFPEEGKRNHKDLDL
jgi:hypothetical protein